VERENILKDIDDLTDANEGLKRALDEAQMEVFYLVNTFLPGDHAEAACCLPVF
jgi:hypothetical protein